MASSSTPSKAVAQHHHAPKTQKTREALSATRDTEFWVFSERETGFEPATSTLARSHSTTELLPRTNANHRIERRARIVKGFSRQDLPWEPLSLPEPFATGPPAVRHRSSGPGIGARSWTPRAVWPPKGRHTVLDSPGYPGYQDRQPRDRGRAATGTSVTHERGRLPTAGEHAANTWHPPFPGSRSGVCARCLADGPCSRACPAPCFRGESPC